jgi:hypothetical protein
MSGNIKTGNISGNQGLAIGQGASANVTITSGVDAGQLANLIAQLRKDINEAPIPEPAKRVMLERAVPAIEEGAAKKQPDKAASGIERINDQLEGLAVGVEHVSRIGETVKKIGGLLSVGLPVAAPYLAKLMGW